MAYQDLWIRGTTTQRGERECDARYAAIRPVIAKYKRPITVLDIGANLGYFGCRLADEFGAVSVMIDARKTLVDVCQANRIPTTIALTRKLSVDDLRALAASEHFDVVLALNVLHHFKDWSGALAAILELGDQILIETPTADDRGACRSDVSGPILDALAVEQPTLLAETPSHVTAGVLRPLLHLRRQKRRLAASYAFGERVGQPKIRTHRLEVTYAKKTIVYKDQPPRDWHPGMNVWNWCQLGGSYPSRAQVQAAVRAASTAAPHGDIRPWNFILQGEAVVAIDGDHRFGHGDAAALEEALAWMAEPTLAYREAPCSE